MREVRTTKAKAKATLKAKAKAKVALPLTPCILARHHVSPTVTFVNARTRGETWWGREGVSSKRHGNAGHALDRNAHPAGLWLL